MTYVKMEKTMHRFSFIIFLTVFLSGITSSIRAQNLDSLEQIVQTGNLKIADRLNLYHDLSYGYAYTDFDKSVFYAREGIALAQNENNQVMTGAFYQDLGIAHYLFSRIDSASVYLNTALEYARKTGNEQLKAAVNAVLGSLYYQKGLYTDAMQQYMQALPILEKERRKEQLSVLYGNIADLYQALHNHDQALYYYFKAESAARELDDQSSLACAWIGLSNVYLEKEEYDKALTYAEKALKILRLLDDHVNEVIALNTVGRCYYKGYKNYDKAREYAEEGLKISEASGFPTSKAVSLHLLSDIAFNRGEYKASEDFAFRALDADSSDININGDLISNIALANIEMGNGEKAARYFKKYTHLINVRADREFQSALSEMHVKYETEKKGIRIAALEKEKRLSDRLAIMGGVLLIAVFVIMSLRYRVAQNKKRLAEQLILRNKQEQQLMATKAVLEGETSGQSKLAKILNDSLNGKLSVVKMKLLQLKKDHFSKEEKENFEETIEILDGTIKELSRTAVYIMPQSLVRKGLKDSLTDFCKTIPCAQFLFFGEDRRLDGMLELTIYRAVYELVTAALQHEGTTEIRVQLISGLDNVSLTIQESTNDINIESFENSIIAPIRTRVKTLKGFVNVSYSGNTGMETEIEFNLN